jgi:2-oxoglutarate dehydrogenase E1 component
MDRFSFKRSTHRIFRTIIRSIENPDSVEPSWRSFFQGFDFGMTTYNEENQCRANANFAATNTDVSLISDKIHKNLMS